MVSGVAAEVTDLPGAVVLRITGEMRLDVSAVERQLIRLSAGRPGVVVLDLSGLSLISSLGIGLLNHFRRGLAAYGGVCKIAAAQPAVFTALKLCNLDKLFEFHPTVDSAIATAANS
jgi:anti-sigma B factor antagonist